MTENPSVTEGSGYHELGRRIADYLGKQGLEAVVKANVAGTDRSKFIAGRFFTTCGRGF